MFHRFTMSSLVLSTITNPNLANIFYNTSAANQHTYLVVIFNAVAHIVSRITQFTSTINRNGWHCVRENKRSRWVCLCCASFKANTKKRKRDQQITNTSRICDRCSYVSVRLLHWYGCTFTIPIYGDVGNTYNRKSTPSLVQINWMETKAERCKRIKWNAMKWKKKEKKTMETAHYYQSANHRRIDSSPGPAASLPKEERREVERRG